MTAPAAPSTTAVRPRSTPSSTSGGKAGTPAFDYAGAADPTAAAAAVQAGAFFTGSVDVKCTRFFFWTTCKPPTAVHVAAYFSPR